MLPVLLPPAGMTVIAVMAVARGQVIGIPLLAFGVFVGIVAIRYVRTISRRVGETVPGRDIGDAIAGPSADHALTTTTVGLIAAIALSLALLVWAIAQRLS